MRIASQEIAITVVSGCYPRRSLLRRDVKYFGNLWRRSRRPMAIRGHIKQEGIFGRGTGELAVRLELRPREYLGGVRCGGIAVSGDRAQANARVVNSAEGGTQDVVSR